MPEIERVKSVALVSRLIEVDDGLRSVSTIFSGGKIEMGMMIGGFLGIGENRFGERV